MGREHMMAGGTLLYLFVHSSIRARPTPQQGNNTAQAKQILTPKKPSPVPAERTPCGEEDAVGGLGDVAVDERRLLVQQHLHAVHRPKLHLPTRQPEELLLAAAAAAAALFVDGCVRCVWVRGGACFCRCAPWYVCRRAGLMRHMHVVNRRFTLSVYYVISTSALPLAARRVSCC
jgi:hypothetical protein